MTLPCGHPSRWALRLADGTIECQECKARNQDIRMVTGYEAITLPPSMYGPPDWDGVMKDPLTWAKMDIRNEDGLPVTPPFIGEAFESVAGIARKAGWEACKVSSIVHAEYPGYVQFFVIFRKPAEEGP